ncbi:MAG: hypothetical protein ACYS47_09345 [Planctomycetota bacterium]|jgi:hypothetical protein
MRRALPCLIALLVLLQLPAGITGAEDKAVGTEAKAKSEFGGSIGFQAVYRGEWLDIIWKRSTTPSPLPPQDPKAESEAFIDGNFSLNATIVPSRSVTIFLDLRSMADAYGREAHRVGDNLNIPQFREAWIRVDDLFGKWSEGRGASLTVGMQAFRYDLRNLGRGAFFMDPTNSENPFSGLSYETPNPDFFHAFGEPTVAGYDGANSFLGGNPWYNHLAQMKKASEAGGIKFVLSPHKNAHLDIGAFMMLEGGIDDIEAGTNVFFLNFDFEFDLNKKTPGLKKEVTFEDTSVFNLIFTAIQGRRTFIGDGGIGLDLLFNWEAADLEIYAEAHYQAGEYYKEKAHSVFGDDMVTHKAMGAMGGLRIKFKDKGGMHPYFDVSGWYLTGDRGDRHEQSEDFMSLESVNDTLIIESDMGLDIDCNYFAAKVEIGTHFPGAKNVELNILGAYFNLLKTPLTAVPRSATYDEDEKGLGFEIDTKLIWKVSEGADLFIGFAFLGSSKFLDMMFDSGDSTMMGVAGLNARF